MAQLIFSKGLSMEIDPLGLIISHDDDIIIETELQLPFYQLQSSKTIHIWKPIICTNLYAQDAIHFHTPIQPKKIQTPNIVFTSLPQKGFVGEDLFLCGIEDAEIITVHGDMFIQNLHSNDHLLCKGDVECDICYVEGDLEIEGACIAQTVIAYGDILVSEDCEVEMLISIHGKIQIGGSTKGNIFRAQEIELRGKNNYIKALQSTKHIHIGEGIIESDIMISSQIRLHPQLQGRIMVVDSKESLGPHLVKGCLGMDFLNSFIGDAKTFIKQRNAHTDFMIPTFEELIGAKELAPTQNEIESIQTSEVLEYSTIGTIKDLPQSELTEQQNHINHENKEDIPETIQENFSEGIQEIIEEIQENTNSNNQPRIVHTLEENNENTLQIKPADLLSLREHEDQVELNKMDTIQLQNSSVHIMENIEEESEEIMLYPSAVPESQQVTANQEQDEFVQLLNFSTIRKEDTIFPLIQEDIQRIIDAYSKHNSLPPPIKDLLTFVHKEDYESLLENMFVLWRNISKYHNDTNSKSPPLVMPTFNKIHAKLRSVLNL